MILQALYDYYQRKAADPDPDPARRLPAFGLEEREIPFLIELAADGRPLGIAVTRRTEGKKKVAQRYLAPHSIKRACNVAANLLCDTAEYVLGVGARGKPERVAEQHQAFRQRIAKLPESARQDVGIQAIEAFYTQHGPEARAQEADWPEIAEKNPILSFRVAGDSDLICQRPAVISACLQAESIADDHATCLVTGLPTSVERLHTAIKGV